MTEVVTMGEAMIRLTPPDHQRLMTTPSLEVHIGGAELNVAVALAQLGVSVAWISKLPDNPLGRRVDAEARRLGVHTSRVLWLPGGKMGLYFYEKGVGIRAGTVLYDRADSAINSLSLDELDWDFIGRCRLFHTSGITPALSLSVRKLTVEVLRRVTERGLTVSFDVNYRSRLWEPLECRAALETILPLADLVVCTERDAGTVFGLFGSGEEIAQGLRRLSAAQAVIVTHGAKGVTAATEDGAFFEAAMVTDVVDRLGAGDAFCAGVIYGYLKGDLRLGVRFGLAMAALKHAIPGDWFIGTKEEVENLLKGEAGGVKR